MKETRDNYRDWTTSEGGALVGAQWMVLVSNTIIVLLVIWTHKKPAASYHSFLSKAKVCVEGLKSAQVLCGAWEAINSNEDCV